MANENSVKIWDLSSGKVLQTLDGHSASVNSVAFSPDGKWLATGSSDETAKIWDWTSGKVLHTLEGHTASVNSVCFSPDGKQIATGAGDFLRKTSQSGYGIGQAAKLSKLLSATISPSTASLFPPTAIGSRPGQETRQPKFGI
ncbi:MAG: PD40 domain-containing protein [Lewinellaceae bacterium]|nr:PD40 domain-containing protein [Lewinellaceae bacterium]